MVVESVSRSFVSALFWKAGFEIPASNIIRKNIAITDENGLYKVVKIRTASKMQEYLNIDADMCTDATLLMTT